MKKQFYSQKPSLKTGEISTNMKYKSWLIVFMTLLISFISLNGIAQTISNVAISPTVFCPGSKVSISFTVTNGIGPSEYFTSSTTYTIYVTNSNGTNFGSLFPSKSSTVPPSIDGGTVTVIFSNLAVPTFPPGTKYKISVGSTSPTFDGSTGINASAPFTVASNPTANYSKVFASTCNGGTDGSIAVTASGGTSPYTYSWTGVNGFTATTASINNLALGDYNVVVEDQNLCSTSLAGITIKMAGPLGVGISQSSPTCAGNDGSLNVFRIGGIYDGVTPVQFKLGGNANIPYQTSGTFSGLTAGSYIVTVQDSKGCTTSQSVNLLADTRPAPTVGIIQNNSPTCAGNQNDGSISAMRIGGVYDGINPIQFRLEGAANVAYSTNNTFTGLSAGTYFVTVKDSRGCTGITQVVVATDTRPAPSVGFQMANPGCLGDDGSISAFRVAGVSDGITPVEYKLDGTATVPYQTSGVFSGLSAGSYTVTVKDSRGCTGSSSAIILSQVPLAFTPNGYNRDVSSCGNGSDGAIVVTVTGGITPYHFILNGVEQGVSSLETFEIANLQANIAYNIMVTDARGCSISKSVTISQVSAITSLVSYTGNATCMGGSNGFIIANQSGGIPGYMYSKDGGVTYQSNYRFLNLVARTYNVVVKDSKGCTSPALPVTIADGTVACRVDYRTGTTTESRIETIQETKQSLFNSLLRIQVYPNPSASSSDFTLDVQGNNNDKVSIIVSDVLGRRQLQVQGNANQQYKLGSNLRQGIYFVQVLQGNNVQTIKIVKE